MKLEDEGIEVETEICDVSNKEYIKRLLEKAISLGEIYDLINAAGIAPPKVKNEKLIIAINALGTYYTNEIFYKEIKSRGCIINIGSICAYEIPRLLSPKKVFSLNEKNIEKCNKKMIKLSRIFGKKRAPNIAYAISKCFVVY